MGRTSGDWALGRPAPPLSLPLAAGGSLSLADLHGRPVLVSFLSHAAWPFARTHLVEVLDREGEIEALGAAVVLVAYDEPSLLEAKMLHHLDLPFPLALDRERTAYAAWGLGRTNLLGAMLSPSLNWRYFRLLLAGERFLGVAPDMFQLGGDFVVDRAGRVSFAHRMRNNGDRATVATLITALTAAAAT